YPAAWRGCSAHGRGLGGKAESPHRRRGFTRRAEPAGAGPVSCVPRRRRARAQAGSAPRSAGAPTPPRIPPLPARHPSGTAPSLQPPPISWTARTDAATTATSITNDDTAGTTTATTAAPTTARTEASSTAPPTRSAPGSATRTPSAAATGTSATEIATRPVTTGGRAATTTAATTGPRAATAVASTPAARPTGTTRPAAA